MSAGGRRGTTCALLRSTRAGGEAPSGPARLRKAPSRGCASSACGRDRGATQTSEGATKPGRGGVFSLGGKAIRWQDSKAGGMILGVICNFSRSLCVSAN